MSKEKDFIQKIWISPYTLVETLTRQKQEGLLLKVLFSDSGVGYSQIHPLSFMGEGSLLDSLKLLKQYKKSWDKDLDLVSLSLQVAQEDAQARSQNKSLLFGYSFLQNHYLLDSFQNIPSQFSIFKVKMGDELKIKTKSLRKLIEEKGKSVQFRLDFNGKISQKMWKKWEEENKDLAPYIDFIEDPFSPFHFIPSRFSLAQDWSKTHYCPIRVIKGSRYSLSQICSFLARSQSQRFIFTHSLTHPLEARLSYLRACQFYKIHPQKKEVCGLYYNVDRYEPNDFSNYYSKMNSSCGKGLGFDDLWSLQKWELL